MRRCSARSGHSRTTTIRAAHLRFGVLCLLAYVALSWFVRFDMRRGERAASLLYPLDTFSMYAAVPDHSVSHLLIRDQHGAALSVTSFRAFDCPGLDTGGAERCARTHGIPYHYDDLMHHIRSHAGSGEMAVELISRTWHLRADGPPERTADCVIARCTVSR